MPSYQHVKHFTLDEADRLIPWLSERAGQIMNIFNALEDKGFEVIAFDGDEAAWAASLDRLARALGRSP